MMRATTGNVFRAAFDRRMSVDGDGFRIRPALIWLAFGGFYLAYFGGSILNTFRRWTDLSAPIAHDPTWVELLRDLGFALLLVALYFAVRPRVRPLRDLDAEPRGIRWRTVAMVAVVYLAIQVVLAPVESLVNAVPIWGWLGNAGGSAGAQLASDVPGVAMTVEAIGSAIAAGVIEELSLVALPVIFLSAAGISMRLVLPVLVVARLGLHLHHGVPTALAMIIWACLALWLYLRVSSVLPLIIGHAAFDILVFLPNALSEEIGGVVKVVGMLVVPLVALVLCLLGWRAGRVAARDAQRRNVLPRGPRSTQEFA